MNRIALPVGLLMTALAGYVDAIGFLRLGGLYTSFMSGNTTQLGILAAHGDWAHVFWPASLLAMFFAGAVTGGLVALLAGGRRAPAVLGLEALCLAIALAAPILHEPEAVAMLPLAFAMGAQNAALQLKAGARPGTTFVTGTLFSAGNALAQALAGVGPRWGWTSHLLVWISMLAGAGLGAIAHGRMGLEALLYPAALSAALAFATLAMAAGASSAKAG
ncbi:YoaK family protein [Alsobacter soli]|nr:YoaK family protein [Alsobacter soli]